MIVVTMTSWIKRIQNVKAVVESVMKNTVLPDKLYLNLSSTEFEGIELPQDLVDYFNSDDRLIINWVDGENVKTMKKVFPILKYLNDDDIIINIDDDALVPVDFINSRICDFKKYNSPITSCNNPKYHYLNKLFKVWSCGPGSLMQKKMLNGWEMFMDNKMIHSFNDDWCYSALLWLNGYKFVPCTSYFMQGGSLDINGTKMKKFNAVEPMGRNHQYIDHYEMYNLIDKRINELFNVGFEKSFNLYHKILNMNLVIFDSCNKAGDNGEFFYDYVMNNFKDIKLTFLISKSSNDYNRLKNKGYNVVDFNDYNISNIFNNATYIIESKEVDKKYINKYISIYKNKTIFLQHGITNEIHNVSSYFKTIEKWNNYICCTSEKEKNIIKNNFGISNVNYLLTGFCRWDRLIEKNNERVKGKKNILISFHWRKGIIDKDVNSFKNSVYLREINKLLNHPRLKELYEENNCTITFMPHARFVKYKSYFDIPDYIIDGNNYQFQDLLVNTDVLITDFSSNAYEVSVINKPVLYYIPDMNYVINNMPHYNVKDFEKYSVGKLHKSVDDLINSIESVLNNTYKNNDLCIKNINNSIYLNDGHCCERLFSKLVLNYMKVTNKSNENNYVIVKKEEPERKVVKNIKIQKLRDDIQAGRVIRVTVANGFVWKRVK